MDSKTLINLYQQGRRNFSGINLADVDLSYAYLRSINLSNACLTNTNLVGVNMTNANLTGANLSNAKVVSAYLGEVDLRTADLSEANFSYTYLAEANLTGSYLFHSNFSYTYLSRAMLMKVKALKADFTKSNLSKANLIKADLSSSLFNHAYLTQSNLSQANFTQADLSDTNLIGSQAFGSSFIGANFTGACIQDWLINEKTLFQNSICDYIYLGYDWINDCFQSRFPHNAEKKLKAGEFDYLQTLERTRTTISLNFNQGIDWQVFVKTWDALIEYTQKIHNDEKLSLEIESIEKKQDNSLIVKIDVPSRMDKVAVAQWFLNQYRNLLQYKLKLIIQQKQVDKQTINKHLTSGANLTNMIRKIAV